MRPTFHPRLVNGPFGDPALLVRLLGMGRNVFFDLGDLHDLPARPVLKATHAFVSHAHIDHFCGLDTLVRYSLGRRKTFRLVGPPGIADRVEGKLSGYTWNLVASYEEPFVLEVLEWSEGKASTAALWHFPCQEEFRRQAGGIMALREEEIGIREVHRETGFRVLAARMNHQIASIAYAIEEPAHANVNRAALDRLGLEPGPWVRTLKEAVLAGVPPETPIPLPSGKEAPLSALLEAGVILVTQGQKLAYIADCGWSHPEVERAVSLVRGAHVLYCESAFLSEDADRARDRHHLTAAQAGELARSAGVAELRVFHFSPKYRDREQDFLHEAAEAFGGPVSLGP
ncbi:MAG: ribonuclease Z [Deltaproteobacteria bacterium]|nr:ribonuclease Z [Deltaproteobacteria bacterium]